MTKEIYVKAGPLIDRIEELKLFLSVLKTDNTIICLRINTFGNVSTISTHIKSATDQYKIETPEINDILISLLTFNTLNQLSKLQEELKDL